MKILPTEPLQGMKEGVIGRTCMVLDYLLPVAWP